MPTNRVIREEEIKNRIREDFFKEYDATQILGDIDFAVTVPTHKNELPFEYEYFLWAEAKKGNKEDLVESFVQLILTIGKNGLHNTYLPPKYIGAFDGDKIAFVEFHFIIDVLYQNDFNWRVTPSNHETKEFKLLLSLVQDKLSTNMSLFYYNKDEKDLRRFIKSNFVLGKKSMKLPITKNNYIFVFQRWVEEVKPSIDIDWNDIPQTRVVDFFYADLISRDDYTRIDNLAVVLRGDHYLLLEEIKKSGRKLFSEAAFKDEKKAYTIFWNKYDRPPRKEYIEIILERRERLIPQNLRKYQGAFFTPPQWVEKSQDYISSVLGEDWQEEYYVWDCAAGTGNLLFGLNNSYNIWASTLDDADVQVMKTRIKDKSLVLLENHVFQFDFLNDTFDKLPNKLLEIIKDPQKRKKLLIYINPPFGEAGDSRQRTGSGKNKTGISNMTKIHKDYASSCGKYAKRELTVQFLMRIYKEIPGCIIAQFSKIKILQAPYFKDFRNSFLAEFKKGFIIPSSTFDNVNAEWPVIFVLWNLENKVKFEEATLDVFATVDDVGKTKKVISYDNSSLINDWLRPSWKNINANEIILGYLAANGNDFENQNYINIDSIRRNKTSTYLKPITASNLIKSCVYFAVRTCVVADWLNDRDQFLKPLETWAVDMEFQSDCLTYALFNNNIKSSCAINHWIPFTEQEVNAHDKFTSHFMIDFIKGKFFKIADTSQPKDMFENMYGSTLTDGAKPIVFSKEAQEVFNTAKSIWLYYHSHIDANPDASFYDIKFYFKGTKLTPKGKVIMKSKSDDMNYSSMISLFNTANNVLKRKISYKVYEHGFLI